MAQVRRAEAWWQGDLTGGSGEVSAATTGVFTGLPVTWKARTEDAEALTSPEELLAAAHASCFSMACSNNLAKAGTPAERLDVSVEVTADKRDAGWTVLSSAITVRGRVPGIDADAFRAAANAAKDGCPISRALAGNVEMSVEAILES
jgi:osmotically inducible protein OsmC